jgi:hypothetical protein
VFKLNEGADGVSIAICAQKHRVQASIFLHRLTGRRAPCPILRHASEAWAPAVASERASDGGDAA